MKVCLKNGKNEQFTVVSVVAVVTVVAVVAVVAVITHEQAQLARRI